MSFALQDLQKIQLNTVYVCNLVNAFWNNNKRNMERTKFANMNKEIAYTKYICGTLYTDATSMYTVIQQVYLHR